MNNVNQDTGRIIWSLESKTLLLNLIKENLVIVSPDVTAETMQQKELAWKIIEQKFIENGVNCQLDKIKRLWKRMKESTRLNVIKANIQKRRGIKTLKPMTQLDIELSQIITVNEEPTVRRRIKHRPKGKTRKYVRKGTGDGDLLKIEGAGDDDDDDDDDLNNYEYTDRINNNGDIGDALNYNENGYFDMNGDCLDGRKGVDGGSVRSGDVVSAFCDENNHFANGGNDDDEDNDDDDDANADNHNNNNNNNDEDDDDDDAGNNLQPENLYFEPVTILEEFGDQTSSNAKINKNSGGMHKLQTASTIISCDTTDMDPFSQYNNGLYDYDEAELREDCYRNYNGDNLNATKQYKSTSSFKKRYRNTMNGMSTSTKRHHSGGDGGSTTTHRHQQQQQQHHHHHHDDIDISNKKLEKDILLADLKYKQCLRSNELERMNYERDIYRKKKTLLDLQIKKANLEIQQMQYSNE